MDNKTKETIFANKKKLCCCLYEVITPALEGISIRIGDHTDRAMNELTKPLNEDEMEKIVKVFEDAHKSLLEIQERIER